MSDVICMHEVSKWFGEVVAVNNLTVSIPSGVTGLLGSNGAGKSTFIKLALGLYEQSRGSVTVLGQAPRNNLDVLRRIGYCPESDTFFEAMTGREFVYWNLRFHGMPRREAQSASEEALVQMRMEERMDDLISGYSRGMRQCVKIAQAIAHKPQVLFLDEPMAGLDPERREELFAFIRAYGKEGRTVLMSSHILYEIERVTDHVVMLRNGCLLAQGHVSQIRNLIAEQTGATPRDAEHPHSIAVTCSDPRRLAGLVVHNIGIALVEFDNSTATFRTRDPEWLYAQLNEVVLQGDMKITAITCPDDNLQSVFEYLTD